MVRGVVRGMERGMERGSLKGMERGLLKGMERGLLKGAAVKGAAYAAQPRRADGPPLPGSAPAKGERRASVRA